jgi:hypothetical protein
MVVSYLHTVTIRAVWLVFQISCLTKKRTNFPVTGHGVVWVKAPMVILDLKRRNETGSSTTVISTTASILQPNTRTMGVASIIKPDRYFPIGIITAAGLISGAQKLAANKHPAIGASGFVHKRHGVYRRLTRTLARRMYVALAVYTLNKTHPAAMFASHRRQLDDDVSFVFEQVLFLKTSLTHVDEHRLITAKTVHLPNASHILG